jgi:hypothetical protein
MAYTVAGAQRWVILEIESRCLGQSLQGLEANHVRVRLALADHQPTTRL